VMLTITLNVTITIKTEAADEMLSIVCILTV